MSNSNNELINQSEKFGRVIAQFKEAYQSGFVHEDLKSLIPKAEKIATLTLKYVEAVDNETTLAHMLGLLGAQYDGLSSQKLFGDEMEKGVKALAKTEAAGHFYTAMAYLSGFTGMTVEESKRTANEHLQEGKLLVESLADDQLVDLPFLLEYLVAISKIR